MKTHEELLSASLRVRVETQHSHTAAKHIFRHRAKLIAGPRVSEDTKVTLLNTVFLWRGKRQTVSARAQMRLPR